VRNASRQRMLIKTWGITATLKESIGRWPVEIQRNIIWTCLGGTLERRPVLRQPAKKFFWPKSWFGHAEKEVRPRSYHFYTGLYSLNHHLNTIVSIIGIILPSIEW